MQYKIPDVSTLRRIRSLSELNDDQLIALANQLQTFTAVEGDLLLERGSIEESSLYVLKGKISLIAADGQVKYLTIGENEALNPVAQLRPSIYDIEAQESIEYLKINKQELVTFAQMSVSTTGDISVYSLHPHESDFTQFLVHHLYQNIMSDEAKLPALPSVAIKITQLYQDNSSDVGILSRVLLTYPEISRKLIKKGVKDQDQDQQEAPGILQKIAGRLGTKTIYYMIMTHVINKLFFQQPEELAEALKEYREHSLNVAATCRALAKLTPEIDPDKAMLAGMSHGIGNLVIIDYLLNHDDFTVDPDETARAINTVRPEFTSLVLRRWKFSDDIIQAAEECEDWFRHQGDTVDLCDLVLVANYHILMRTDRAKTLPPISTIPAMKKLNITPNTSIALLEKTNIERKKIERMLRF